MTFDTRPFPMFSSSYYYRRYCQGLMYTNTYSPTPYSIAFHRKNGTFSSSSNEKLRSGAPLCKNRISIIIKNYTQINGREYREGGGTIPSDNNNSSTKELREYLLSAEL